MRSWIAGMLLVVMAGAVFGQPESPLDDPAAVKAALDAKLPHLDRSKETLSQALRYLGGMAKVNVYVDEPVLAAAGYAVDQPTVAVSAKGISLRQCLDDLIKGYQTDKAPLRWSAEGGVIIVSTADDPNWRAAADAAARFGQTEAFAADYVIPEIRLENARLEEVLEALDGHGINLFVRWNAVATLNINRHNKVSLSLTRVRPRTAMQLLVRRLAGPKGQVGYAIHDGVWVISTPADLNEQVQLWARRPYNVGDQESANRLATILDDASFDKPFGEALEDLARMVMVKIEPDWTALKEADVEPGTLTDFAVRRVRVSTALDLLLADVAGVERQLDYSAKDNEIRITAKKPAQAATTRPAASR